MNYAVVWQLVRHVLMVGGAYLTSKGLATEAMVEAAVAAIITLGTVGLDVYLTYKKSKSNGQ